MNKKIRVHDFMYIYKTLFLSSIKTWSFSRYKRLTSFQKIQSQLYKKQIGSKILHLTCKDIKKHHADPQPLKIFVLKNLKESQS